MTHRLPLALAVLGLYALNTTALAGPPVQVTVQWLPDPGMSADWDRATRAADEAAAVSAGERGPIPEGIQALYELLDRAGHDAVIIALEDSDPGASPVQLARAVADEVPLAVSALCAEDARWDEACDALDQVGITSVGVKAPGARELDRGRFEVRYGLRPAVFACIREMGCGQDER